LLMLLLIVSFEFHIIPVINCAEIVNISRKTLIVNNSSPNNPRNVYHLWSWGVDWWLIPYRSLFSANCTNYIPLSMLVLILLASF
jgi:hypothetical protein